MSAMFTPMFSVVVRDKILAVEHNTPYLVGFVAVVFIIFIISLIVFIGSI